MNAVETHAANVEFVGRTGGQLETIQGQLSICCQDHHFKLQFTNVYVCDKIQKKSADFWWHAA